MKQLSASETSVAIQARIQGLQLGQIAAVNRLQKKDIPGHLIMAAAEAHTIVGTPDDQQHEYQAHESAIITHVMQRDGVSAEAALKYINS